MKLYITKNSGGQGGCPSLFKLQRFFARELEGAEKGEMEAHTLSCNHCAERLKRMEEERSEFLERFPAEAFSKRVRERLERKGPLETLKGWLESLAPSPVLPLKRWVPLVPALATLLILVALFLPWKREETGDFRIKGAPSFGFYVEREGEYFKWSRGTPLFPGDKIQFEINPAGYPFLIIVSIDEEERVFPYAVSEGDESIATDISGKRVLDQALLLDEYTGFELLLGIFTREPLSFDTVHRILKRVDLKRLVLEGGTASPSLEGFPEDSFLSSLRVEKRSRPDL